MSHENDIAARIEVFRHDLRLLPDAIIVQKYITFGGCYILTGDDYFELKSDVSSEFLVHPSEVVVVGSAKLGFSIAESKRFRHFGDNSDIDIAIISPKFFDQIWVDVFEFSREGAFWPGERDFKNYLFRGWIRPDKLPPADRFQFRQDWWNFFQTLEKQGKYGPYKLRAGVYKSWQYLERYQTTSVHRCREGLGEQS